jgi:dTDP-glucose pyrophosphorylase
LAGIRDIFDLIPPRKTPLRLNMLSRMGASGAEPHYARASLPDGFGSSFDWRRLYRQRPIGLWCWATTFHHGHHFTELLDNAKSFASAAVACLYITGHDPERCWVVEFDGAGALMEA